METTAFLQMVFMGCAIISFGMAMGHAATLIYAKYPSDKLNVLYRAAWYIKQVGYIVSSVGGFMVSVQLLGVILNVN